MGIGDLGHSSVDELHGELVDVVARHPVGPQGRGVEPERDDHVHPHRVHGLAHVGTRLSDLGDSLSKQIINWGYVVCDRSVRANYTGPLKASAPQLPYPDAKITQA